MQLAGLVVALLLIGCSRDRGPANGFNVIVVSLDTLRADHLGAYGYVRDTSPSFDALATEGVVFEAATSQSASTYLSHTSLFQSKIGTRTTSGAAVLAEVFQREGYRTVGFHGGGYLSDKFGFSRGFESYEGFPEGLEDAFPQVENWLRQNRDATFFAFLHTYDIHAPYDPPPPFDQLFLADYEVDIEGESSQEILDKIRSAGRHEGAEVNLSASDRAKLVALYDGGIRYVDGYVGRLVELLKELDLWRRTVVVVLSDHGEEFWDHGSVSHGHTVYQELIHVPLIWWIPGERYNGRRIQTPVRLMDVGPTLLDLLHLPRPRSFEGESLLPLMNSETRQGNAAVAETEDFRFKSLLIHPWKLIRDVEGRQSRLYHLVADPGETRDLQAGEPDMVARLERRLKKLLGYDPDARQPSKAEVPADEELRQQLRALGYLNSAK